MKTILFLIFLGNILIGTAHAGEADVIAVEVKDQGNHQYAFDVTVSHKDEGWDHYADRWEVVGSDGVVYGNRTLLHPHVNEQPFTRSKSGVKIPTETKIITIRAHDSVHEYGGVVVTIAVP